MLEAMASNEIKNDEAISNETNHVDVIPSEVTIAGSMTSDEDDVIPTSINIPVEIQNTNCMDVIQSNTVEVIPETTCGVNNVDLILNDINVVQKVSTDVDDGEMTPGAVCRICYGNSEDEVLLNPCHCSGSVQYSHETCLMTWLKTGATTCEICKFPYRFQKHVKPWWSRTHPNITLWHLGWVLKELVVLDWFHFLETVFICISLVIINRMSSFDLVYQFALIGLIEFLYYTLNIFSCFFLLYYGRWARLNMKVIVLNYNDEHPIVPMGILYRGLDSYSSLLQRNKRLKQVVDQINEAEGEY